MRKLTKFQKEFILNYFFKNEKYAGWRDVANKLLEKGECIVSGGDCIWNGGIGNFIKTEKSSNLIDCLEYKFDLEYFITSKWYREIKNEYMAILSNKKIAIEEEYNDINNI